MALNKVGLKVAIKALISELMAYDGSSGKTPADAQERFAQGIADAVDSFVKTGTVTVSAGIPATCPPPTGVGVTTGPGTGTIS